RLLINGYRNLKRHRDEIDKLNVFPIPDGDTGKNMMMTYEGGVVSLEAISEDSAEVLLSGFAKGTLLSARGNSGVILSQFFRGFAEGAAGKQCLAPSDLLRMVQQGAEKAYGAVLEPVEGTMLTVMRESRRNAAKVKQAQESVEGCLETLLLEMERSLAHTPELLPVLKESGVVDSGGAGLGYVTEGMAAVLSGREVEAAGGEPAHVQAVDLDAFTENSVLEFGYCTEFLLRLQTGKVDLSTFQTEELIRYLNSVGESVVCFREGTIVKVHVHTKKPGDILNKMQEYGEFLTFKMENMTLQHNENHMSEKLAPKRKMPHKPYGVVSVAAGEGIKDAFGSLGCDAVVDGGQSMNPSAQDLIAAFEDVNADVIFVFPNNSNIIMTAKQAAQLYTDAEIRVVPTKTIGEGYAAISMLDTSSGDTDAIMEELEEIIAGVVTGIVSRAVRDTEMDGVAVHKDDYIGFVGDTIYTACSDRNEAAAKLCEATKAQRYDIMLLVCGADASAEEAQALCDSLQKQYRRTEIVMIDGGQPIYDYIIILE
ncbi:MAG: DAK2 domain-containing protein, partial [Ruminococcus sp.]|nr:DAK2 domain-containing protein [Ruminococcus sp.]